jgi:hypothetical protein
VLSTYPAVGLLGPALARPSGLLLLLLGLEVRISDLAVPWKALLCLHYFSVEHI